MGTHWSSYQYEKISRQKFMMWNFKGRSIFRLSQYRRKIFQVKEIIHSQVKSLKCEFRFRSQRAILPKSLNFDPVCTLEPPGVFLKLQVPESHSYQLNLNLHGSEICINIKKKKKVNKHKNSPECYWERNERERQME